MTEPAEVATTHRGRPPADRRTIAFTAVKDCLDTLRHLQTAVLIVSAALLALAVAPNDAAHYDATLKTLREMTRLTHSPAITAQRERNQADYRAFFARVDAATRARNDIMFTDAPDTGREGQRFFERDFLAAPSGPTLADEVRFYQGIRNRLVWLPEPARVAEVTRKIGQESIGADMAFFGSGSASEIPARCEVSYTPEFGYGTIGWSCESAKRSSSWHISISRRSLGTAPTCDRLNGELVRTILPKTRVGQFTDDQTPAYLDAIVRYASLDLTAPGWEVIRELPLAESIRQTEERALAATRSLSLLGLEIDERLATFGGPLALWLTLLYLTVHVVHLRRLAAVDASPLASYPWPPLFANQVGAWSSAVLLLALPTGAAIRFARRAAEGIQVSGGDARRYVYVAALAGAIGVTGLVAHFTVRRLPRPTERKPMWQRRLAARWTTWKPVRAQVSGDIAPGHALRYAALEWLIAFAAAMLIVSAGPLIFGGWAFERWATTIGGNVRAAAIMFGVFAAGFIATIVIGGLVASAGAWLIRSHKPLSRHFAVLLEARMADPGPAALTSIATTLLILEVWIWTLIGSVLLARVVYVIREWKALRALHAEAPTWRFMLAIALPSLLIEIVTACAVMAGGVLLQP